MQAEPPLLDRTKLQCLDLRLANQDWIREFALTENLVYVGYRPISSRENVGYFMTTNGAIYSIRKSGEILQTWQRLSEFLSDELKSAVDFSMS